MQRRLWRRLVAPMLVLALLAPSAWAAPGRWVELDLGSLWASVWGWAASLWQKAGPDGDPWGAPGGSSTGEQTDSGPVSDPWG